MGETVERTKHGAIVYDPRIINHIDAQSFVAAGWSRVAAVPGGAGAAGRGNTLFVSNRVNLSVNNSGAANAAEERQHVLRHYQRGGLIGRVLDDAFFWQGERRTRSFAEWRLMNKLFNEGFPVPQPAAARYRRSGLVYTADLLTVRLDRVEPLSKKIIAGALGPACWARIGQTIQRFHAAGVYHADLNSHNVQIDANLQVYLLDFDRGRLRQPGDWRQANLDRLLRSLRKISEQNPGTYFSDDCWQQLLAAYSAAARSA